MIILKKIKHFFETPQMRCALFTTFSNGLATLAKLGSTLLSIPLLVNYFGSATYGLIVTITTMCIWLTTIADAGFGLALKNELIKALAQDEDLSIIKRYISTAFFVILGIAAILCLAASLITPFLPWHAILNLQLSIPRTQIVGLIILLIWLTLFSIPLSLPRLILSAMQKEFLFSVWQLLGAMLGLGLLYFFIYHHANLILTASALQIGSVIALLSGIVFFIYMPPKIRFKWQLMDKKLINKLFGSSFDFLILQFTALMIFQSDIFIVNYMMGQESAAIYALHFQLFSYFQLFIILLTNPFWSVFSEAFHKHAFAWFKKCFIFLCSVVLVLCLLYVMLILNFGQNIINLLGKHQIATNQNLLIVLGLFHIVSITIGVFSLALNSFGDTRQMKFIVSLQAISNVVFSIIFIHYMGIIGCALGSLLSCLLTITWFSPIKLFNHLRNADYAY